MTEQSFPEERENPEESACRVAPFAGTVTGGKERIAVFVIAGQIEGHQSAPTGVKTTRYEHLLPLLAEAEEDPKIHGVLLLINTVGGDVEAGLCLAEMIAGLQKPTAALVLGGGHSIGIPLAVAARHSFIVPSATMTVHPVRITGLVLGVPQSFEYLARMQDRICDFVVAHSRIKREKLDELMAGQSDMATDVGTILRGKEAVELGLIGGIGGFADAVAALKAEGKRP